MNKTEYLDILAKELRQLSVTDKQKAMEYYEEYFVDAGVENESGVIEELGNPKEVAEQIIKNLASEKFEKEEQEKENREEERRENNNQQYEKLAERNHPGKKIASFLKIILLVLLVAPIGIFVGIILFVGIFTILLLMGLIFFLFFIIGAALVLAGVASAVIGIGLVFTQPAQALSIIGMSLFVSGMGLLISYAAAVTGKFYILLLRKAMRKWVKRPSKEQINKMEYEKEKDTGEIL